MSADNVIYVRKVNKHWRVWMSFASDEVDAEHGPMPPKKAARYDSRKEAMAYAHGYQDGLDIVEYGIIELPSIWIK